jgi:amidase
MSVVDTAGAFCAHGLAEVRGAANGPLAGLTFGVKDLYDLAGILTGNGSPEWLATHPVPTRTAPAVQRLLDAGATCVGKTQMDELAWSLMGENARYGTPLNASAPGRIPGGSSSGSAAAAAAGLVDFSLGSDTGGSVRLPASFCGLYGMRPTHGRIPMEGAVALAPSYDSAGWFARSADMLAEVGRVLLSSQREGAVPSRLLVAIDLFAIADPGTADALMHALRRLESIAGPAEEVSVAGEDMAAWRDAFRTIQTAEVWATHGAWVTAVQPDFGPGIRERFAAAAATDPAALAAAQRLRVGIAGRLRSMLPAGTVLLLPSSPGPAPLRGSPPAELEAFRARALALLCLAGHAGLPQVSLPLASVDGLPVGLSVVGGPGTDEDLLALAQAVAG